MDSEAWWATVHRVAKSQAQLSMRASHLYITISNSVFLDEAPMIHQVWSFADVRTAALNRGKKRRRPPRLGPVSCLILPFVHSHP